MAAIIHAIGTHAMIIILWVLLLTGVLSFCLGVYDLFFYQERLWTAWKVFGCTVLIFIPFVWLADKYVKYLELKGY